MDPIGGAMLVGGAANLTGGILGAEEARKGRAAAERAALEALAYYDAIKIPTIQEQLLNLLTPQVVGEYTPEMLQALALEPSAMEQVRVSPELKQQQLDALAQMEQISKGGMTEADAAAMRQIQRQTGQQARARQLAVLNDMAQRGALGSGMELAAQLQAGQQADQAASEASDRLAQELLARKMAAIQNVGSMSGQARQQEFGEQSDVARARDAIAQFNLQNRQNVMGQNIAERNTAAQRNLAARQAAEESRVNILNQQQQLNKALQQQKFLNEMQLASSKAAARQGVGQAAQQGANALAQMYGNIGGAIGNIAGSYAGYQAGQQKSANDLEMAKLKYGNK